MRGLFDVRSDKIYLTKYYCVSHGHMIRVLIKDHHRPICVFAIHGGPGSGIDFRMQDFFENVPAKVVLIEQRSTGLSRGNALECNDTEALLGDIVEVVSDQRSATNVVFGHSWGGTLAIQLAKRCPREIDGLVLCSTWLARQADIDWFAVEADRRYAHLRSALVSQLARFGVGGNSVGAVYALLQAREPTDLETVLRLLDEREHILSTGHVMAHDAFDPSVEELYRRFLVQYHFMAHGCFLAPDEVVTGLDGIACENIRIMHGSDDQVCPVRQAHDLADRIRHARLTIVEGGHHTKYQQPMFDAVQTGLSEMLGEL